MSEDNQPDAPVPEHDFTGDPYWGKGGRYVVDPATGKRMPAPVLEEVAAINPTGESIAAQIEQPPADAESGVQIDPQGLAPIDGGETAAAEAEPAKTLKEKRRG